MPYTFMRLIASRIFLKGIKFNWIFSSLKHYSILRMYYYYKLGIIFRIYLWNSAYLCGSLMVRIFQYRLITQLRSEFILNG